jgi:hypothetical protein
VSEGAWVGPLATVASPDVAFLITVGGSAMAAAQQTAWYWENRLRYLGVRGSLLTAFPVSATRLAVDAGMFPEAHYDGLAVLERVRVPVLLLWGEDDINHPPAESSELMEAALERGKNRSHTTRFIAGGGRDLLETTDQGFRELSTLAPSYPPLVASWVDDLADGAPPSSSAHAPIQDRRTQPLAPMARWESASAQLAALGAMALGLLSYPGLLLLPRLRTRRTVELPTPNLLARTAAVAMALTLLGWLAFMAVLQVNQVESVGPVLLGRPVVWLVLELASFTAAAALVALVVQTAHRWPGTALRRLQVAGQLLTALVFIPWATYWGLLIP